MTHLSKKNWKIIWKTRSTEFQSFPISPRQDGLKWAAILRISHFPKSKCLQSIICLWGNIGEQFKSLRGFGGLQGSSGQTPKNGDFCPFRPFLGVCPEPPWRPPNSLILLKCSPIVLLKHMTDWRHLLFRKCEILRMAAHFSPSCLGLMGNLGNPLALFFDYNLPIFFTQVGHWRSKLAISEEKKITS